MTSLRLLLALTLLLAPFSAIANKDRIVEQVILVAGVAHQNGKVLEIQIVPGKAYMSKEAEKSNFRIEGLDENYKVVSVFNTAVSGDILLETTKGSVKKTNDTYMFSGTLLDTGNIKFVRLLKDNKLLATKPVK